ncbi:hypothetical protein SDJN03_26118, partial [Cucurbita argyrosperma subsp. sororia]
MPRLRRYGNEIKSESSSSHHFTESSSLTFKSEPDLQWRLYTRICPVSSPISHFELRITLKQTYSCSSSSSPSPLSVSLFIFVKGCGRSEEQGGKRKKKREKKKRANLLHGGDEPELTLLYPFTSSTTVIQRKIKRQYDELMKCQESKELTLAQVRQFANCLINVRSKLQHKADVIRRKFTITKALLCKADRSSLDRLQQQIYKLELEQKRLEEDTFVFNWLQQQLKLSPAYKKMLEIGSCMELMEKSENSTEKIDPESTDISFEELLAQEKKDSFWQRNGKLRSCSS